MSRLDTVEFVGHPPTQVNQQTLASRKRFDFEGPFFRTDEAAAYLNYRGPHALRSLYRFLEKKGVPTARRFRTILIKKVDLDRCIGAARRKAS